MLGRWEGEMNETGVCFYVFYGLTIKVCWEGEGVEDEIELLISPFPFTPSGGVDDPVHLEVKLTMTDAPSTLPDTASGYLSCYDLSIFENGGGVYLTDGLSHFQVQPQERTGIATLHRSFKGKPLLSKYNFFLLGLIHLLSPYGFYDLHAAGLVRDGIGYLFLGESGSGKSSAAISLVRQGWRYVSDDALLLRPSRDGMETLSFRKKFFIDPVLSRRYPEILPYLEESMGREDKRFFDVESVYPDRFRSRCTPRVLIYTRIGSQPESKLMPIDKTRAFIQLMRQSASLFFKREAVRGHLDALKQLVSQADSYELLAGRDVYERPEKISEILSRVIA